MNDKEREKIGRALRDIVHAHAEAMQSMEETFASLRKELALDPKTFWKSRGMLSESRSNVRVMVDRAMLSIEFGGQQCFLGNTLPFKFISRLANRPNAYVPYEELLSAVWEGPRSDSAIRSVVKTLRKKLRESQMSDLADSIDGSVPRHYALKLDR